MLPMTRSSMLGCMAAVTETESPSQPRPVVIQTTCTSFTAGGESRTFCGVSMIRLSSLWMRALPSRAGLTQFAFGGPNNFGCIRREFFLLHRLNAKIPAQFGEVRGHDG